MQISAVLLGFWYHGVYDDLCDFGHIAECAGFLEQAQDLTLASRGPQWAILEVGRVASPFAQPLFGLGGPVAWGIVLVCEGEQVGGDFALVRLLEARQTEGPRLEESRCRIGLWRGLVRVEWTAIVLGRAILVPARRQLLVPPSPQPTRRYRVEILDQICWRWWRLEGGCVLNFCECLGRGIAAKGGEGGADSGPGGVSQGHGGAQRQVTHGHDDVGGTCGG